MNILERKTLLRDARQRGYTLIELLLYITILGGLLGGITTYFVTSTSARTKNQSIAEVDSQGTLAMDLITQTIRNATSITSPSTGASAASLTLVVPTASLSPTIINLNSTTTTMGYNTIGTTTDADASNHVNATKFTASASGTVSTLYARIGASVGSSPNNMAQMAIYSGTSNPTTLLASSAAVTITASSWVAFPISSVSVTSGQTYWLAYNTNGTTTTVNNLVYHTGSTDQSRYIPQTYGTWPASYTGTPQNFEFSVYALIDTGGGNPALQIKEGAASAVALTNSKVTVSALSFTNMSISGTKGIVRVSFVVSRNNPNNLNDYDYQKTFIGSAALR